MEDLQAAVAPANNGGRMSVIDFYAGACLTLTRHFSRARQACRSSPQQCICIYTVFKMGALLGALWGHCGHWKKAS